MSNKLVRLLVVSVLILSVFSFPQFIQKAHAAPGLVCIAPDLPAQTACPASPISLTGPVTTGPATLVRVQVFIQVTDPMNGFEVTLLLNHNVALPVGVDLTGSIIGNGPTVLLECLQNVAIIGGPCTSTDTLDTMHLAAVAAPGAIPGGTTPPGSSGLLFTAIYSIQGSTTTPETIGFQVGCTVSSVTGTTTCINISNGTKTPPTESAQTGTLSTSTTQPAIQLSPNGASLGTFFVGSSPAAQSLTITDVAGGYLGSGQADGGGDTSYTLSVSVTPPTSTSTGVTAAVTGSPFAFTSTTPGPFTSSLTITNSATAAIGTWTVVVTGLYHFDPTCIAGVPASCTGPASTLAQTVTFTFTIVDFIISSPSGTTAFVPFWCSASTSTVLAVTGPCPTGNGATEAITVTPAGYTGTVTVATGAGTPTPVSIPPLLVSYSATSIAGASGSSTATFSNGVLRPLPTAGSYTVHTTLTGTLPTGTRVKTITWIVRPQDFNITTSTGITGPTLQFNSGLSTTDTLTLGSLPSGNAAVNSAGFAGPVTLTSLITGGTGLVVTPTTSPVTLVAGQKLTDLVTFSGTVSSTTTFSVTITGTATSAAAIPSTTQTHSVTYSVTIVGAAKDTTSTSVSCTPGSIIPGQTSTCSATVTDTTTPSNIPSGVVTFTLAAGTTGGSLSSTTCTLSLTGSCAVTFQGETAVGTASVSASYGGDANHSTSSSTVSGTVTVVKDSTSTSVSCLPLSINVGLTSTCTATVADTTTGSNVPTGTVTFTLSAGTTGGSLSATTCTLTAGSCSVTFQGSNAAGTASVSASYAGDGTHNASASTVSSTITVTTPSKDNTSTMISCTPGSITTAQTSSCTATVTDTTTASSIPSGTVTFTLSAGTTGGSLSTTACALSATGTCSITFQGATAAGTATVSASYGGDGTHNGSSSATSATITVTLPVDNTSTSVACTPSAINTGQTSTCTATVTDTVTASNIPTGTVTFTLSAGTTGGSLSATTCSLSATGTCSVTFQGATAAGSATISASYAGDTTHHPSSSTASATITVSVPVDNTSTSVACTPGSISTGQTSTCTATVTDTVTASNIPSGTVTFTLSAGTTGGSLSATTCTLSGTGTCTVTFQGATTAGSATVSGSYGGDATHHPSSTTVSATITVSLTLDNTSTTVSCTPGSITTAQTSSCTATVTDTTTASNIPTGTVTFTLSPGTTGGSLSSTTCTLSATGTCSVTFQGATAAGTASVSATYGGDTTHAGSSTAVSATITVTLPVDNTATTITCTPGSITTGQTSTCKATVTDVVTASNIPTGTVTFTLAAGTTGGSLSSPTCTLSSGSCSVTFQGSNAAGTASVSASYSGDTTHNPSATTVSATITVTLPVPDNTSTTLACAPSAILTGQTSNCTATVVDTTTASHVPTGTVTFILVAGTTGGSLSSTTCALSATGSCSVMFQGATAAGVANVTANYNGDATHLTSISSALVTVSVPPFDYTLSNNGPVTIQTGTSGSVTITAKLTSGTTQNVTLSCMTPLPTGVTCTSFTPSFLMPSSTGATSVLLISVANGTSSGTVTILVNGSPAGATVIGATTSVTVNITVPTTGQPVLLTFQGFDIDDCDNGVGQLTVLVNGHLVVNLPSQCSALPSRSGDFAPNAGKWMSFGPFDITSFVVSGQNGLGAQNTIVFMSPPPGHFGLVKNVTITQGNVILLHVPGARPVSLTRSATFTFSIPPLVITSFTSSPTNPTIDQNVTFTATYTGGTAPFHCFFSFGDGEFAFVSGTTTSCAATHDYDNAGNYTVRVLVVGSSTSDLVFTSLKLTVSSGSLSTQLSSQPSTAPVDTDDD